MDGSPPAPGGFSGAARRVAARRPVGSRCAGSQANPPAPGGFSRSGWSRQRFGMPRPSRQIPPREARTRSSTPFASSARIVERVVLAAQPVSLASVATAGQHSRSLLQYRSIAQRTARSVTRRPLDAMASLALTCQGFLHGRRGAGAVIRRPGPARRPHRIRVRPTPPRSVRSTWGVAALNRPPAPGRQARRAGACRSGA